MEFGCEHYQRRCRLVAPCCNEAFWCRHCHNAAKHDDEPNPDLRHILDRKAVKEVICAVCNQRQPVAERCWRCGTEFGRYFCGICKFFDDDLSKEQFHCDRCGVCRVGGRQNSFHCDTCNCCYHVDIQNNHVCIKNSMHSNCPVCQEYLFDSITEISVLTCGHTIHDSCLRQLKEKGFHKCPICQRTVGDMAIASRRELVCRLQRHPCQLIAGIGSSRFCATIATEHAMCAIMHMDTNVQTVEAITHFCARTMSSLRHFQQAILHFGTLP